MLFTTTRRQVLQLSVLAAGVPAACYRSAEGNGRLSAEESAAFFPQSVASGDPRPESVVLWTRVEDSYRAGTNLELSLLVGLDPELRDRVDLGVSAEHLPASVDSDHTVIVRVSGLSPATTYYYRFEYLSHEGYAQSRIGRTRTAPAEDSGEAVRFGVVCCQDYNGKYFHLHRHLAEQDLDFVLHLGDYVYETVGDPSFQSPTDERQVVFGAPEEALQVGSGDRSFLAAQSLSNYRDLYKTYRSDPDLQALHERHPIIALWDDHEFSDDCHADVANYSDGREDEASPERRAAADQAWYEFMPVDYNTAPALKLDPKGEFPDNFGIYRSFVFGKHLELLITDLRRHRPDHLVPEDAPPGAVFLTQSELLEQGDLPSDAVPYIDIEAFADGSYLEALREGAETLGVTPDRLTGNISAVWINQSLETLAGKGPPAPIDLEDPELERGYAYHSLLKSSQFSRIGSRYVVALEPYEALARARFEASNGKSERLMGDAQRKWFLETLKASTRTFKVWASGVAFQPRHLDLSHLVIAPPELRRRISISAEDWDGFPNERRALLGELAAAGNAVVLSGDLHCFFAGTPCLEDDPETRVVELTTGSISSTTWLDAIEGSLTQDASIPMDARALIENVGPLLEDKDTRPNPHLAFKDLGRHGYSIVEVGSSELQMTLRTMSADDVRTAPQDLKKDLEDLLGSERFRTPADSADLQREVEGEYLTWNMESMAFE